MAFRPPTQWPPHDCLYAVPASIPRLTRSALHCLFQRQGRRRLPLAEDGKCPPRKKCNKQQCPASPSGYLHVTFAEVRLEAGQLHWLGALDRTSKGALAELPPRAPKLLAAEFLRRVLAALPYEGHTVRPANGPPLGNRPHQLAAGRPSFARVCHEHGGEHRFTKPAHPWTTGQVERRSNA